MDSRPRDSDCAFLSMKCWANSNSCPRLRYLTHRPHKLSEERELPLSAMNKVSQ